MHPESKDFDTTDFEFSSFLGVDGLNVLIEENVQHRLGPTGFTASSYFNYTFQCDPAYEMTVLSNKIGSAHLMDIVDPYTVNESDRQFVKNVCIYLMCLGRYNISYADTSGNVQPFPFEIYDVDANALLSRLAEAAIELGKH